MTSTEVPLTASEFDNAGRVTNGMPPAMLLCGGQGTRIRDVTEVLPKPMVPIGSQPILWHIMKNFAAHGVSRFILCLGYKREAIIDYFLNYHTRCSDITIRLAKSGNLVYHSRRDDEDWEVTLVDTGERTMTGARVARACRYLAPGDEDFFLTYGDGLANVNILNLLAFHRSHDRAITVTAVHPAGRFGEMEVTDGTVTAFHEKPQTAAGLINGGYMVIRRKFVERYLTTAPELVLEEEPLRRAAHESEMAAFLHQGFWQCMDTAREHQLLNRLWEEGKAPWAEAWK